MTGEQPLDHASTRNGVTGSPVMMLVSLLASDQRGSQPPSRPTATTDSATSRATFGSSSCSSWFCGRCVSHNDRFWYGVNPSAVCTFPSKPAYRPSTSPARFGCNCAWYSAV